MLLRKHLRIPDNPLERPEEFPPIEYSSVAQRKEATNPTMRWRPEHKRKESLTIGQQWGRPQPLVFLNLSQLLLGRYDVANC